MANLFIYVAAAAGLLLIYLIFLFIKRKRTTFGQILTAFTALAVCAAMIVTFIGFKKSEGKTVTEDTRNSVNFTRCLFYEYVSRNDYENAESILSDLRKSDNSDELLLMQARIYAMKGQYTDALNCYNKYSASVGSDKNIRDEYEIIKQLGDISFSGNSAVSGTDSSVPAVKLLSQEERNKYSDDLENLILSKAEETDSKSDISKSERKKLVKYAEAIIAAETTYKETGGYLFYDEATDTVKDALRTLKKAPDSFKGLEKNKYIRNAVLLCNIMLCDSTAVANNINDSATSEELMTALELLADRKVTSGDFTGVETLNREAAVTLKKDLSRIKDKNDENLSADDALRIDDISEYISSVQNNVTLKLVSLLLKSSSAGMDSEISKLYLESAKACSMIGNGITADDYIDKALESYAESKDTEYVSAMASIAAIIGSNSSSSITAVSGYVDTAVGRIAVYDISRMEPSHKAQREAEKNSKASTSSHIGSSGSEHGGGAGKRDNSAYVDFNSYLTNSVVKKSAGVNIGEINKSSFPTVSAIIAVSDELGITEKNFKKTFTIHDCGYEITEYTVKKLENMSGKIILACDMSGSMYGSDGQLREAVRSFVSSIGKNEQVEIAGFTDYVEFTSGYSNDPDELEPYIKKIYASGGTGIYRSLTSLLDSMTTEPNSENIIIIMTDGQDNYPASEQRISSELAALAAEKNCTIYTLGMGSSIDERYLETIASCCYGNFLYANSAESLAEFYDFIHQQLNNRYEITFEAIDRLYNERELSVYITSSVVSDSKYYRLTDDIGDICSEEGACTVLPYGSFQIYGLSSSYIYKSDSAVTIKILGKGFNKNNTYKVTLKGELRQTTLESKITDEETLEITIPASTAIGVYDITVSLSGEPDKTLEKALTIAKPSSMQELTFGAYKFTAEKISQSGEKYTLSGNVVMNGWLHFKGSIMISAPDKLKYSYYVTLYDENGSYISYSSGSCTGLAKLFADKGKSIDIPPIHSVTLYGEAYDPSSYGDFKVQAHNLDGIFLISSVARIMGAQIILYPDMIYTDLFYIEPDLHYFDKLIPNLKTKIYSFDVTGAVALTNTDIRFKASVSFDYDKDSDTNHKFQFFEIGLCLKKFALNIDTISQNYSVSAEVGFKEFPIKGKDNLPLKGIGFSLEWKNDKLDSIMLSASTNIKILQTPVPVYIGKMGVGISDMSKYNYTSWTDYLKLTVTGKFKLQTDDLLKILDGKDKKIKKLLNLEDLYLAEIDDAVIKVSLGNFNLNFAAKMKILGVNVAKANISIGKFPYINDFLDICGTGYGIDASLTGGIMIDNKNLELDLSGTHRITLAYPYFGLQETGKVEYHVSWGIFDFGKEIDGGIGFLISKNSSNQTQLTIKVCGRNAKGKLKGFRFDFANNKCNKEKY